VRLCQLLGLVGEVTGGAEVGREVAELPGQGNAMGHRAALIDQLFALRWTDQVAALQRDFFQFLLVIGLVAALGGLVLVAGRFGTEDDLPHHPGLIMSRHLEAVEAPQQAFGGGRLGLADHASDDRQKIPGADLRLFALRQQQQPFGLESGHLMQQQALAGLVGQITLFQYGADPLLGLWWKPLDCRTGLQFWQQTENQHAGGLLLRSGFGDLVFHGYSRRRKRKRLDGIEGDQC
jgi:hypothetical protein